MTLHRIAIVLLAFVILSCNFSKKENNRKYIEVYADVNVVGAMKNVMWNGELASKIDLDTISDRNGLYGIGPMTYLTGELLINDGKSYVSKVTSDSSMDVEKRFDVSAPFFVYANISEWSEMELPTQVKTIPDLESFIDTNTSNFKRPFAFKLIGRVSNAVIHIQDLPKGTKVASPEEAHQGQTNYFIQDEDAEIIGFFSTQHKGIFTHHDSFLHMHLITKEENKMGHLDELQIGEMKLLLPIK